MSTIFEAQHSYEELWEILNIMPSGNEKDILLLRLLIKASDIESLWNIYWATEDGSIQELALGRILTMTHDMQELKRVLQYADDRVELLANVKFDLCALEYLEQEETSNATRLRIAHESSSYECRIHALKWVLNHSPTHGELWEVYNHPNCTCQLKRVVCEMIARTPCTELDA